MKGWPGEPDMEYDVLMADGEAAANAGKPITDVIFDFGNVLIYWDPAAVMTPRYDDELVERFLDNDISGFYDINNLLDGGMSNDEGVALMRKTSGDQWADMLQYYLDNFVDSLTFEGRWHRRLGIEQLAEGPVPDCAGTLRYPADAERSRGFRLRRAAQAAQRHL